MSSQHLAIFNCASFRICCFELTFLQLAQGAIHIQNPSFTMSNSNTCKQLNAHKNWFSGRPTNSAFYIIGCLGSGWWRQTGSNRRPEACKATALPTELCPQLFYPTRPPTRGFGVTAFVKMACQDVAAEQRRLVGLGGLEPPTSRLSSARSNQLSYRPNSASAPLCDL